MFPEKKKPLNTNPIIILENILTLVLIKGNLYRKKTRKKTGQTKICQKLNKENKEMFENHPKKCVLF